ncbi:DEAD/DEAH box helicase family protein [Butyrivibrio proteoclasticus]|uniref:DEAD/DEAH box helicase family protein n=1 Tax=Butyrivibrio proteoclasticus TaxID=43305 RepID=UPI00047B6C88|nr:DEAD/DEAH box helicase family protein [Butyrivibrio proteoclasticus]
MDTNFGYLQNNKQFSLFGYSCIEAENVLYVSPAISAFASRRALELCVKWVYAVEPLQCEPRENLQGLLHNNGFPSIMDYSLWRRLQHVVKYGNSSAHTNASDVTQDEAIYSLQILFDFVQWIDYCYGEDYQERKFDEKRIPGSADSSKDIEKKYVILLNDAKENLDRVVTEKDEQIQGLLRQIEEMTAQVDKLTKKKEKQKQKAYRYEPDLSEFETRKRYIDADLKELGYIFEQQAKRNCINIEYPVTGMPNNTENGDGAVDYVVWGDTGKIVAVIEAKRTSKSAKVGKTQAFEYANCIERMQGDRPLIFYTNGFDTYLWDDKYYDPRKISFVLPLEDINRIRSMKLARKSLGAISINENIVDREYQLRAVTKCCQEYERGKRKCLLVMATGTGKTRTAAALVDVMMRANHVQRVLFLADRIELVSQAKDAFSRYIENTPACNLLTEKEARGNDFVFSTYPTMLNAIDNERNSDGSRFFSPAHFDLIIVDEAHRSIFNKYKAIFEYFDAALLGLTATPRETVDRSTYEFFDLPKGHPTDVYTYEEARDVDKFLAPYYTIEVSTKITSDGIKYSDLSEEEKEEYEDAFSEDETIDDHIPPAYINKYIFNKDTADKMIRDIMKTGIPHASRNHVGKTIIFAQSKKHADFLVERFDSLYSEYKGKLCCKIVSGESYNHEVYNNFKKKDSFPFIAITVDKLETGVDIPEVVNLVFAKKVYSRIRFDQMLGRGTRLCPNLFGEGFDKKEFCVFDYMRNFEFFEQHPAGREAKQEISYVALRFARQVKIIRLLQNAQYIDDKYQSIRNELVDVVWQGICGLKQERIEVKLKLKYVEKYRDKSLFICLGENDQDDIITHLANLITTEELDNDAISFDAIMYGLMISALSGKDAIAMQKRSVISNAVGLLSKCALIPDVKEKIPQIRKATEDVYWDAMDPLAFEQTRRDLRGIMHYYTHDKPNERIVDFDDEVIERKERRDIDLSSGSYDEYRSKVGRYIDEHKNNSTISKLVHNKPITSSDYKELERIFTSELGSKEDYEANYQNTPFGILIRRMAKMDREAAMQAFSSFIAKERPNAEQIYFIEKVVDYLVENGCVESVRDLMSAPFDRPVKFTMLFSLEEQKELIEIVNGIKENALVV